ncbi:hybrid sensor histidine kinase/response regulator [Aequorivita echinoideorum]|uniref:histidine kinase n=1 Tax=Aequorivita echinoideorum TaxID=1549647 RepID=A0ABS5S3Y0_9FLAO|nr:hybrid sensor histidine kinase/response regulator [Aequorivita echinoideorum]MBT0607899.1 response regulator [Aequorivita echinoideorum]
MKQLLLLCVLVLGTISSAQTVDSFNPEESKGELYEYAEFAKADHKTFSLYQIQNAPQIFRPLPSENHSVGFTSDNYWVKFNLKNTTDDAKTYYLETGRPITDFVNLYQISENGDVQEFKSGDQILYEDRQVPHRASVFRLEIPENTTQQFYINLKSDGETINLPLNLYNPRAFWRENYTQQLFLGLFYGLLILAGIIYMFFYTSLKQKAFLYYGAYVFSIGFMQAALDGFLFQYFFQDGGYFSARAVLITAVLSNFFLLKYCEYFLNVNTKLPKFKKLYNILYGIVVISFLLIFISPKTLEFAYPFCNLNGLLSLVIILATIFTMRVKRIRIDPYFSFGVFFLVIGLLGFVMNNLSLLPNNFFTLNSAKFGTGFEIIFLSISMTNLIRKLRLEKENSQDEALQKSEEISEMKSYFMSNMSHELRTPLNTIMGIAEVEMGKQANMEDRKQFEMIKNASLSLLSNVNDILDFEKIEKNEIVLKHEEFNPSIALHQISNNWKTEAENKGLAYKFEMDYEIPTIVLGDVERFIQIINNVLSNAVKFTEEGSVYFKFKSIKKSNGLHCFSISVTDTGVGMSQEYKKNVFNSFNQMRLGNKRKFGGIGLGLTIVRHLVELHHGSIHIESNENEGTNIYIDILLQASEESKTVIIEKTPEIAPLRKQHVLVVEDNLLNQMVMRKMLNSYEHVTFAVVNNGKEAIEALKKDVYDIVLMDLQMPIMDGYEATEIIRSGELGKTISDIPIIAVTADALQETRSRVLDIGMNDYMTKPVSRDLLLEKMNKHRNILKIA